MRATAKRWKAVRLGRAARSAAFHRFAEAIGFVGAIALFSPAIASAHEVYVLPHAVVERALSAPGWSELTVLANNLGAFAFWAFAAGLAVFVVFFVSLIRPLERWCDPLLAKLPPYAPAIARITVGLSFLAAAYYGALFGPELPLPATFGAAAPAIAALLVLLGIMITFGIYTRLAALAALCLFAAEAAAHGFYLLTYTNYLGEIIVLLILGAHHNASRRPVRGSKTNAEEPRERSRVLAFSERAQQAFAPYAFATLRVAFGISLLYASLYAKVIHDNLALSVAYAYPSLVHFFGFEPHFLVLGAAIIEILIALFFILGIEIRFTSLFLLFWLSLSLWYFGEAVWPHVILIGIPIAFIFYGYDAYSLEGRFFKRGVCEPVL